MSISSSRCYVLVGAHPVLPMYTILRVPTLALPSVSVKVVAHKQVITLEGSRCVDEHDKVGARFQRIKVKFSLRKVSCTYTSNSIFIKIFE